MMKQINYKKRAVIHGLSMAVFLGACLGLQADDKQVSADASVSTDRAAATDTTTDRKNDGRYSVTGDRNDAGKLSRGDANFVREAAQGGLMEVRLGQSAKDHGSSPDVKNFGEMLVKDHSKANDKLTALATQKGMNLAKDIEPKHTQMIKDWEGKQGNEFDRVFIEHMVKDHKKDISKFEKASRDLNDSELRSFATETLPTLRTHLDEAQRIAKSMGLDIKAADASEYGYDANNRPPAAAGSPGLSVESQNSSVNRVDHEHDHGADVNIDTQNGNKVNVDTSRSAPPQTSVDIDTSKGDGKVLGVESRKGDSKVLGVETTPGDGKTLGLNTRKDDGKFLGVIPDPKTKDENRVDVDVNKSSDHKLEVTTDADRDRDHKIEVNTSTDRDSARGTTASADAGAAKVDADLSNGTASVDTSRPTHKILGITSEKGDGKTLGLNTRKDDGKYLGIIPKPGYKKPENRLDVDVDKSSHNVEVSANTPSANTSGDVAIGAPASSEKGSADANVSTDTTKEHKWTDSNAKVMSYSEVPTAVQDTIRKEGGDTNVKNIKRHTMNGKVAYKVEIKKEGRNRVLQVAEDGTIIKDNNK